MAKEKKKGSFWKDFKAFITRGNVIDMAVGVVIGGSFGKIVTGLVNYIINPFIGYFMRSGDLDSLKTIITPEVVDAEGVVTTAEVAILWGTWLQTILDFLITAICIFVVLRIIMKAKNALEEAKNEEQAAKAADEKAAAEKAAAEQAALEAEKAARLAEREAALEQATLNQEKLLVEIRDLLKKQ